MIGQTDNDGNISIVLFALNFGICVKTWFNYFLFKEMHRAACYNKTSRFFWIKVGLKSFFLRHFILSNASEGGGPLSFFSL